MKYQEIKAEAEKRLSTLLTECGVFWAFSNEQFEQNKTPLKEGEKYVSIGMGGYMPKGNIQAFSQGNKDLAAWQKAEIKKYKQQDEQIKYELYNHECFYTGDVERVCELLPDVPKDRILKVYHEERRNQPQTA